MADAVLRTFASPLESIDRARIVDEPGWSPGHAVEVTHLDGIAVSLTAFASLMVDFRARRDAGEWDADRSVSDRWLAPRVHWALRLTRAQASDRSMWLWLALRHADYVEWRWAGDAGVTEDRWTGGVNKHAFARLWWGGEIFRNGPDYAPVARAFVRQDLPNSYLHRPFVRCRPLAQALLDVAAPEGREMDVSADDVNDLARAVNLATAGAPPEAETQHRGDDVTGYLRWVREVPEVPADWGMLPVGPPCADTTSDSLERASSIATRCLGYTHTAAEARGSRSTQRRAKREQGETGTS